MKFLNTQKKINLLKSFYNFDLIEKTIKTYEDFLIINAKKTNEYYELSFKQINFDYNLDTLTDEFINYLLALEYEHKNTNST